MVGVFSKLCENLVAKKLNLLIKFWLRRDRWFLEILEMMEILQYNEYLQCVQKIQEFVQRAQLHDWRGRQAFGESSSRGCSKMKSWDQSSESLHFNFEVKLLWKNNFIAILKWSEVILFLRKMKWSEVKLKNITSFEIKVKWSYFSISKFWSEVKWSEK